MRLWFELRERLRALVAWEREDGQLDEELSFHLDRQIEKNVRHGMSPEEARRQAALHLGGATQVREATRDARGVRWLDDLAGDLRFALRLLRRSPLFTGVAVAALALGIGATTAVFGLANWALLRPVPGVAEPDELMIVALMSDDDRRTGLSYANFVDLRGATPALVGFAGYAPTSIQASIDGGDPLSLSGATVVGDYFGALGVRPQRGRFFVADELEPGGDARVVVISDALWRSWFGAADDVLGRRVRLNGSDFTVIGVAPPGFHGTERLGYTDVWFPAPAYPLLHHHDSWDPTNRRISVFWEFVGRLAPGATPALAERQLRLAMARLVEAYPDANRIYATVPPTVFPGIGTPIRMRERIGRTVVLLLGVVSLVLLIACANVANLLLFRGVHRRGEIAVRRALGASAGRVFRQHAVEGVLLALAGGAVGIAVAGVLARLLEGLQFSGLPPIEGIDADARVLGFALAVSLGTGLFFGAIPALAARRRDFQDDLKASARTGTGTGSRVRGAFTVVQIAASMALLVGALLLGGTIRNLNRVDVGFDPEGVLVFGVNPEPQGYTEDRIRAFRDQLLDGIGALPGTEAVGIASSAHFAGGYFGLRLRSAEDAGDAVSLDASAFFISPDYFATLGIPLLSGRTFTRAEYNVPAAAAREGGIILSRTAARRLFGGADPLGRRVIEEGYTGTLTHTVIGVVGDLRGRDVRAAPDVMIYRPLAAAWQNHLFVLLRTSRPRADAERAVREVLAGIDPSIPFYQVASMREFMDRWIADERLLASMLAALALLAATLAAVGLYGVIAYSVARRTREIGIRMALGARAPAVVSLVARQSGTLVLIGTLAGWGSAAVLSRFLESTLFGVEPVEPPVYLAAAALFGLVALAASFVPARAAARVDPIRALRSE